MGILSVSGSKITFQDVAGAYSCARNQKGTYTWSISAGQLHLKVVSDACAGRKTVLSHAFRKLV